MIALSLNAHRLNGCYCISHIFVTLSRDILNNRLLVFHVTLSECIDETDKNQTVFSEHSQLANLGS
jgi:hypothetical protein